MQMRGAMSLSCIKNFCWTAQQLDALLKGRLVQHFCMNSEVGLSMPDQQTRIAFPKVMHGFDIVGKGKKCRKAKIGSDWSEVDVAAPENKFSPHASLICCK